jgi:hypothetical protein
VELPSSCSAKEVKDKDKAKLQQPTATQRRFIIKIYPTFTVSFCNEKARVCAVVDG